MRKWFFSLAVSVVLGSNLALAQSGSASQAGQSKLKSAVKAEFAAIGIAAILTIAPRESGILTVLGSTSVEYSKVSDTTNLIIIGSLASLGLYNAVELSKDRYSPKDRFGRNLAWANIFMGVAAVSDHLWPNNRSTASKGLRIMPIVMGDGFGIGFATRF